MNDSHQVPKWIPLVAFLVIGIPIIAWAVTRTDSEKDAAEDFLAAMAEQRHEQAFDLLSLDAQSRYGSSEGLAAALPLDEWIIYRRDGSDMANDAVDASARFEGQDRKGFTIYLVEDTDGSWRINEVKDWR